MPLVGKRLSVLRQAELVPDQIHQVGRILAVVDGEVGVEADLLGIFAQQPRADAVERAGPGERVASCARVRCPDIRRADALDAALHLGRGAAREGQQQDAARIGAVDDQMGDAMRQRVGLAEPAPAMTSSGPPAPPRRDAVLDGAPLFGVELSR